MNNQPECYVKVWETANPDAEPNIVPWATLLDEPEGIRYLFEIRGWCCDCNREGMFWQGKPEPIDEGPLTPEDDLCTKGTYMMQVVWNGKTIYSDNPAIEWVDEEIEADESTIRWSEPITLQVIGTSETTQET